MGIFSASKSVLLSIMFLILTVDAQGGALGISYSFNGNFSENFDSMGTGSSAPGTAGGNSPWSVMADIERFNLLDVADDANDPGGVHKGYNAGLDADKALGIFRNVPPNTGYMIARFTNNTGGALTNMSILYDVELQYDQDPAQPRWGGAQAYISKDNSTYYDLGSAFEGTVTGAAGNAAGKWVSDDIAGNANRDIGGSVNLVSLFGSAIAAGEDFYVKFDLANGVTTPAGYGVGNNKEMGIFIDNLRIADQSQPAIPEPSTYFMLITFLTLVWYKKWQKSLIYVSVETKERK